MGRMLPVLAMVLTIASGSPALGATNFPHELRTRHAGELASNGVLTLDAPDIAENPAQVSVGVDQYLPPAPGVRVRNITFYADYDLDTPLAVFHLSPRTQVEGLTARVKLRRTAWVYAVARLSNDRLLVARKQIKVTIAGCGGGGSIRTASPSTPTPAAEPEHPSGRTQARTWRRSTLTPNTTRLKIGDREALPLREMRVHVRIDGPRARVLLDLFYHNPHNSRYEGRFQLRLPDGAVPYYLAFGESVQRAALPRRGKPGLQARNGRRSFDPKGIRAQRAGEWIHVKEARMVPKTRAAFAYTRTVQRRVDPALLEWGGAGVFNARVFPLAPRKQHRIVVGYDMDLERVGDQLEYRLDLPKSLPRSSVHIDVARIQGTKVESNPGVQPVRRGGRLHYQFDDPPRRTIRIRMTDPGNVVLTGTHGGAGNFFAARLTPRLPAHANDDGPEHAVFAVDTSLSANPDHFNVSLELLDAVLANNQDRIQFFAVLFFNVEAHWWQRRFVANTPANRKVLQTYARRLALEGATDLGVALREAATPAWLAAETQPRSNLFLLSDGAPTWGETDAGALAGELDRGNADALFAYRTGLAGSDSRLLNRLAAARGGAVFSVTGPDQVEAASRAHRRRPWTLVGMELAGGCDLLLAGRPRQLYPGQQLKLVGRGAPRAGDVLRLRLRRGGEPEQVVRVPLEHVLASPLAPRAYGQVAVTQLEQFAAQVRSTAQAYGMHFRVTGRTTSLLMLDSEQDYRAYDIKPENNAFVVNNRPVSSVLDNLDNDKPPAGDARLQLLTHMERLERMRQIHFSLTEPLRVLVETLPADAFTVPRQALRTHTMLRNELPKTVREALPRANRASDVIRREAERRLAKYGPASALKILSSLVERRPGDPVVSRDVAYSAMRWDLNGQAFHLLRRVAADRPYEPQTYHGLALLLAQMQRTDLAMIYFEIALTTQWEPRFGDFHRVVAIDYLRFLRRIQRGELATRAPDFARARLDALRRELNLAEADLVVTLMWNTDATDVDLHVEEPSGEVCFFRHRRTASGGRLSRDVTRGYGPEMYILRRAAPGPYTIRARYYASNVNRATTRTKAYLTIYKHWGTAREEVIRRTATLEYGREMHDVARIYLGETGL